MDKIAELDARLANIEARNERVTGDKAWETSAARRIAISIITYVFAVFALEAIGNELPFLNGLIPVIGYVLSTQTLPRMKAYWLEKHTARNA